MDKVLGRRIDELILFLKRTNDSELTDSLYRQLEIKESHLSTLLYQECCKWSGFCRFHLILNTGLVHTETQERLSDNGFLIEYCSRIKRYFIRTEKGLLTF